MNLFRGLDMFCFDKDEFMKVCVEFILSWVLGVGFVLLWVFFWFFLLCFGCFFLWCLFCDRFCFVLCGFLVLGLVGVFGENMFVKLCMLSEMV